MIFRGAFCFYHSRTIFLPQSYHLPTTVVPSSYQVRITFEVGKSTDFGFEVESLFLVVTPAALEKSLFQLGIRSQEWVLISSNPHFLKSLIPVPRRAFSVSLFCGKKEKIQYFCRAYSTLIISPVMFAGIPHYVLHTCLGTVVLSGLF